MTDTLLFDLLSGNAGKPLNLGEVYDLASDSWTPLPDMPTTHCSCAFIMYQGRLHVIGGLSVNGPSNAMEAIGCQ